MVPVLMQTPPTTLCFSTTATRFPALAAWIAARCPPGPEPMTTRSYCCMGGFLCSGLRGLGWGRRGRRLLALCERDSPMKLSRSARPVYISAGQDHQMFLDGKGLAVPAAPHVRVLAIGAEQAGFAVVREIGRQNLLRDALAQGWILQGKSTSTRSYRLRGIEQSGQFPRPPARPGTGRESPADRPPRCIWR